MSDWDDSLVEGAPDELLVYYCLLSDRKHHGADIEFLRLETRTAMRLLELLRQQSGISPRVLMRLEAEAKLLALKDTEQPLRL